MFVCVWQFFWFVFKLLTLAASKGISNQEDRHTTPMLWNWGVVWRFDPFPLLQNMCIGLAFPFYLLTLKIFYFYFLFFGFSFLEAVKIKVSNLKHRYLNKRIVNIFFKKGHVMIWILFPPRENEIWFVGLTDNHKFL